MSDSLTTLISKVQGTLGDDGTYFTTAIITAAARQALRELNETYPVNEGTLIETVADQHEYVLSDVDFANLIEVISVLLWDDDGDEDTPLDAAMYYEDNVPAIRLHEAQSEGEFLLVRFTTPQTINGLDSETTSTLPAWIDPLLVDGISWYSLITRGIARVEANNLSKSVPRDYSEMKTILKEAWTSGLAKLAKRAPVSSEKSNAHWEIR